MFQSSDTHSQVSAKRTGDIPSRGSVLCVITDRDLVDSLESSLVQRGFTLTRARHGMHGYWLAVTAEPDVIITDTIQPEEDANYFLECLARNPKTAVIPVMALLDTHAVVQAEPGRSCLDGVAKSFLKTAAKTEVVAALDRIVAARPASPMVADDESLSRFDAVFAELGHVTPKAPWSVDEFPRAKPPHGSVHPVLNPPHHARRNSSTNRSQRQR